MAKRLVQLKKLIIRECPMIKEIVGNDGHELTDNEIEFTVKEFDTSSFAKSEKLLLINKICLQISILGKRTYTNVVGWNFYARSLRCTKAKKCTSEFLEECWRDDRIPPYARSSWSRYEWSNSLTNSFYS
ncbi:hypothetical protein AAG906_008058 [Vitis piasezkii]